jgi:phosphoribosylamine--glycine ligase
MNVLVVGGGAREHALCLALRGDPNVATVWCAPGNAGTTEVAQNVKLDISDPQAIAALATSLSADLVVVGPEGPLVAGAADAVRAAGIVCFGPSKAAAQLEGSKAFAKDVMASAGVPTAHSRLCTTPAEVDAALEAYGAPYVVKDDGLAAGKGVVVTDDPAVARAHAQRCGRVVIEEYLDGPEISLLCITDGVTVVPLAPAQDFKRVGDDDTGPNTGGMGAYSPLPWAPPGLVDEVVTRIAGPVVNALRNAGSPFAGLLYVGLALTKDGLQVVEFNARFGDPETQVVLARLRTPLGGLLTAAAQGRLAEHPALEWSDDAAVTVVIAADGYPASPRLGDVVDGTTDANDIPGVHVLHAGTTVDDHGVVRTSGGRVLSVTATGETLTQARERAYDAVDRIAIVGSHYRRDIAAAAARDADEALETL